MINYDPMIIITDNKPMTITLLDYTAHFPATVPTTDSAVKPNLPITLVGPLACVGRCCCVGGVGAGVGWRRCRTPHLAAARATSAPAAHLTAADAASRTGRRRSAAHLARAGGRR